MVITKVQIEGRDSPRAVIGGIIAVIQGAWWRGRPPRDRVTMIWIAMRPPRDRITVAITVASFTRTVPERRHIIVIVVVLTRWLVAAKQTKHYMHCRSGLNVVALQVSHRFARIQNKQGGSMHELEAHPRKIELKPDRGLENVHIRSQTDFQRHIRCRAVPIPSFDCGELYEDPWQS
jgi:hypothetical protein